jgi:hypothetical protein
MEAGTVPLKALLFTDKFFKLAIEPISEGRVPSRQLVPAANVTSFCSLLMDEGIVAY